MMAKINHFLLNCIAYFVLEPRFRSGKWRIKQSALIALKPAREERDKAFADAKELFDQLGACDGCHASCCRGAFNRFTVYDHVSHLVADIDGAPQWGYKLKPIGSYAANRIDERNCEHFEEGRGCRLEHRLRPAQCVWYSCSKISNMMTAQQKRTLKAVRKRLDRVFWRYVRVLLFGGMDRVEIREEDSVAK